MSTARDRPGQRTAAPRARRSTIAVIADARFAFCRRGASSSCPTRRSGTSRRPATWGGCRIRCRWHSSRCRRTSPRAPRWSASGSAVARPRCPTLVQNDCTAQAHDGTACSQSRKDQIRRIALVRRRRLGAGDRRNARHRDPVRDLRARLRARVFVEPVPGRRRGHRVRDASDERRAGIELTSCSARYSPSATTSCSAGGGRDGRGLQGPPRQVGRMFAVKVLQPAHAAGPQGRAAVRARGRARRPLHHPNVIGVGRRSARSMARATVVMDFRRGPRPREAARRGADATRAHHPAGPRDARGPVPRARAVALIHRDFSPRT